MRKSIAMPLCLLAIGAGAWSCVDDKYDLSDIDTTVQIKVDDLVVPINIDKIDMSSIVDLDEDGIVKIVNNEYAIVKDGTIKSASVRIDPIVIKAANIRGTHDVIQTRPVTAATFEVPLRSSATTYTYKSTGVTDRILAIDNVNASFTINIAFAVNPNPGGSVKLNNLKITLPKGLKIADGNYDVATGVYTAQSVDVVNGRANLSIAVEGVDFSYHAAAFDVATHTITFAGELRISDGVMRCVNASVGNQIEIAVDYSFSDIGVHSVDGVLEYPLEDVNATNVDINDLPDVLSQPGTDISLANPIIYLSFFNPLNELGLKAESSLSISAFRNNGPTKMFPMADKIIVGGNNPSGVYNYYLSPKTVADNLLDAAYPAPHHYDYASLGDILSGDGLPSRLEVNLNNPCVPRQSVSNLRVGHDYGNVTGTFKFVAPLQFKGGSNVIYTNKMDGWHSEDMDYMTIETLFVTATVDSDVPLQLTFTGYPIDEQGRRINNVSIEGAKVDANARGQEIAISISGEITGLDGIEFTATATAAPDGAALSPDMQIHLSNVRPRVSGYYQKEL